VAVGIPKGSDDIVFRVLRLIGNTLGEGVRSRFHPTERPPACGH
jgi:hypothetical protein